MLVGREGAQQSKTYIYLSTYPGTLPTFHIPTPIFPLPLDYILVLLTTRVITNL